MKTKLDFSLLFFISIIQTCHIYLKNKSKKFICKKIALSLENIFKVHLKILLKNYFNIKNIFEENKVFEFFLSNI